MRAVTASPIAIRPRIAYRQVDRSPGIPSIEGRRSVATRPNRLQSPMQIDANTNAASGATTLHSMPAIADAASLPKL